MHIYVPHESIEKRVFLRPPLREGIEKPPLFSILSNNPKKILAGFLQGTQGLLRKYRGTSILFPKILPTSEE